MAVVWAVQAPHETRLLELGNSDAKTWVLGCQPRSEGQIEVVALAGDGRLVSREHARLCVDSRLPNTAAGAPEDSWHAEPRLLVADVSALGTAVVRYGVSYTTPPGAPGGPEMLPPRPAAGYEPGDSIPPERWVELRAGDKLLLGPGVRGMVTVRVTLVFAPASALAAAPLPLPIPAQQAGDAEAGAAAASGRRAGVAAAPIVPPLLPAAPGPTTAPQPLHPLPILLVCASAMAGESAMQLHVDWQPSLALPQLLLQLLHAAALPYTLQDVIKAIDDDGAVWVVLAAAQARKKGGGRHVPLTHTLLTSWCSHSPAHRPASGCSQDPRAAHRLVRRHVRLGASGVRRCGEPG